MLSKGNSGLPDWTEPAMGDEACGWRGDDCGDVGGERITGNAEVVVVVVWPWVGDERCGVG